MDINTFEFWVNHPEKGRSNSSKAYSRFRRISHLYKFIQCLFEIQKLK
jgi:hypothetical protein